MPLSTYDNLLYNWMIVSLGMGRGIMKLYSTDNYMVRDKSLNVKLFSIQIKLTHFVKLCNTISCTTETSSINSYSWCERRYMKQTDVNPDECKQHYYIFYLYLFRFILIYMWKLCTVSHLTYTCVHA